MSIFVVLLGLLCVSSATLAPLVTAPNAEVIPGSYIIVYKDEVSADVFEQDLLFASQQFDVVHQYRTVLKGFAANLDETELAIVRSNDLISHVEHDQVMKASACSPPSDVFSWGLTRISQQDTVRPDDKYTFPTSAGEGVTAYVIDTGVYVSNVDFEGRATFGWKADNKWTDADANGHGTHVSSTVAGVLYGVARKAKIVGVKVLGDDGRGSNTGVIAGVDWAVSQILAGKQVGVINMSLGGGFSSALNMAVNAAVAEGVVVVVAAGNENVDACSSSPASATDVITVGATEQGSSPGNKDWRSLFSNFGKCLDVFAPGTSITAAWIGGTTATRTISGTSMASPHVAGIAALLRGGSPSVNAKQIIHLLLNTATDHVIDLDCSTGTTCAHSPNKLAWNGCTH